MNAPKISVIIPLYNAEKYIRQCLISVLASKFKDYEVLVVDDCSTDNSVAEVQKLSPYFDGRLKIFSTEKNTGGPGVPRNLGIKNSSGKYVTFVDNDDLILPDALENFFAVAEIYNADVVYAEKHFLVEGDAEITGKNLQGASKIQVDELVEVPTLEPFDLSERIRRDIAGKFFILPWSRLYRRDFLLTNEIFFPQIKYAEDVTFCFKCLCLAKNYVRIPHMTNIHRRRPGSAGLSIEDSLFDVIRTWLDILTKNISIIETFTRTLDLEPSLRHDVLNHYVGVHFEMLKYLFQGMEPHEIQKIFFDALKNPALNSTGKDIFTAQLCAEKFSTR